MDPLADGYSVMDGGSSSGLAVCNFGLHQSFLEAPGFGQFFDLGFPSMLGVDSMSLSTSMPSYFVDLLDISS